MLVKDFDKAAELADSASPGGVFMVTGEEPCQALRLEKSLETRAREMGLEIERLSGDEVQPGDFRRLATEGSLFASGRLIITRNTDGIGARSQPEVLDAVNAASSDHIFLFLTDRTSLNTVFLKKIGERAVVFPCWEPFPGRMWTWTRRLSGELGLKLDRQASETVEALAYGRLFNLRGIIERLSMRYGPGTVITPAMVLALSGGVPECNALEMSQDAVTGRRAQALEKLSILLESGEEPIRLLALIHSQWVLAAGAAALVRRGGDASSVASSLGISPYRAKWVTEASGFWLRKELAPVAEAFAETDFRLKRGWDPMDAMAPFIIALTLPAG